MKQVWKFEVSVDEDPISMPKGAQILSAGFQNKKLFVWALVDPVAIKELRFVIARGTGYNIRLKNTVFIQTVFIEELVFHVFEVTF